MITDKDKETSILDLVAIKRNKAKERFELMKDNFYLGQFEALEELYWILRDEYNK